MRFRACLRRLAGLAGGAAAGIFFAGLVFGGLSAPEDTGSEVLRSTPCVGTSL